MRNRAAGDVDGHVMSVAKFSGLATFPDGTIGTAYFVSATDYIGLLGHPQRRAKIRLHSVPCRSAPAWTASHALLNVRLGIRQSR